MSTGEFLVSFSVLALHLPNFRLIVLWCSVISVLQVGKESAEKCISINKRSATLKGKIQNVTSTQLMSSEDLLLIFVLCDG